MLVRFKLQLQFCTLRHQVLLHKLQQLQVVSTFFEIRPPQCFLFAINIFMLSFLISIVTSL